MKIRAIDAPMGPLIMLITAVFLIVSAITDHQWLYWLAALLVLICLGMYLNASLNGKYQIIDETIRNLHLKPTAQVLDLGCGQGAALIRIAQHLEVPGRVIGIDLWKKSDQSNNSLKRAQVNLQAAELADLAEVQTADMINLPFDDHQFDCVFASLSIHNVKPAINRARAIQEATRVLKADGTLAIIDIEHVDEYQKVLENLGFHNVMVKKCGVRGWWGGPWLSTKVLLAKRF